MSPDEPDADEDEDDLLIARVSTGDEGALSELYSRYSSVVFAFVLARTTDHSIAEEVCADVWLGCWRSAPAFRHDSRVLTWILGIAKRQIYSHTRRKPLPTIPIEDEHDIPSADQDIGTLVVSTEMTEMLIKTLNSLPPDLIEVVRLAWVYELAYKEIAELMDIPLGTVKSRISRARRVLREQLRTQDV